MIHTLGDEYIAAVDAARRVDADDLDRLKESIHNHGAVFTGVGKSGMVAERAAATGRSLGLDTRFVHATEALHGDGGVFRELPVVAFTHSGRTSETCDALMLSSGHGSVRMRYAITGVVGSDITHIANVALVYDFKDLWTVPLGSLVAMSLIIDAAILATGNPRKLHDTHPGGAIGESL